MDKREDITKPASLDAVLDMSCESITFILSARYRQESTIPTISEWKIIQTDLLRYNLVERLCIQLGICSFLQMFLVQHNWEGHCNCLQDTNRNNSCCPCCTCQICNPSSCYQRCPSMFFETKHSQHAPGHGMLLQWWGQSTTHSTKRVITFGGFEGLASRLSKISREKLKTWEEWVILGLGSSDREKEKNKEKSNILCNQSQYFSYESVEVAMVMATPWGEREWEGVRDTREDICGTILKE